MFFFLFFILGRKQHWNENLWMPLEVCLTVTFGGRLYLFSVTHVRRRRNQIPWWYLVLRRSRLLVRWHVNVNLGRPIQKGGAFFCDGYPLQTATWVNPLGAVGTIKRKLSINPKWSETVDGRDGRNPLLKGIFKFVDDWINWNLPGEEFLRWHNPIFRLTDCFWTVFLTFSNQFPSNYDMLWVVSDCRWFM